MKRLVFALALPLALIACQQSAPVEVTNVWARDSIGGTANAAIFMTITSPVADRLTGASTPAAKKTDLMTMTMEGGAMGMSYLKAIDLPANQAVSLNASGLHVWLAELNQPLKAGQSFPLTLRFEKAGERQVTVTVIAPAASPPATGT